MRLRLFFVSSFACFVLAACGGKVVLDSSGGTGTGGAGGTAACATFCDAYQSADCTDIQDCSTTCLSAFSLGSCQSQLAAALECAATALSQGASCTDAMAPPSCEQTVSALDSCESGTGVGGTAGTAGFGAGG